MTGALRYMAALAWLAAVPAAAEDSADRYAKFDAWIDDRVRIFADVCMESAPGFERFGELAAAAGLEQEGDRWRFRPDVWVWLHEVNGNCSCIMSMAALELDRQIASLILKLHEDRPETVEDPVKIGVYSELFPRDGVLVRVALETRKFEDHHQVRGLVIGWEPCPS